MPGVFTSSGIFLPFYEIRLLPFCCHPGRFLYGVCCCLPSFPKEWPPAGFGNDDQQENAPKFNNNF